MRDYHIKDPQVRQAEIIPVDEKRLFVDEYGKKIEEGAIRFGMKDAGGRFQTPLFSGKQFTSDCVIMRIY